MRGEGRDFATPRGVTWPGLLFLGILIGFSYKVFGKETATGMVVGASVGLVNFKAIVFVVRRTMGPGGASRVLYGVFGFLKFMVLAAIFFCLIYYRLFDVYGIVAGFSMVLLLILIEGILRAGRSERKALMTKERRDA